MWEVGREGTRKGRRKSHKQRQTGESGAMPNMEENWSMELTATKVRGEVGRGMDRDKRGGHV